MASDKNTGNKQPVCKDCGSEYVLLDAWVAWDKDIEDYVVDTIFDKGHICNGCGTQDARVCPADEYKATPLSC